MVIDINKYIIKASKNHLLYLFTYNASLTIALQTIALPEQ